MCGTKLPILHEGTMTQRVSGYIILLAFVSVCMVMFKVRLVCLAQAIRSSVNRTNVVCTEPMYIENEHITLRVQ